MRQRLLIVDDSMTTRNRIARVMDDPRLTGLRVVGQARDGAEALQLARSQQPDVVTMDLTMPTMDGAECISALVSLLPDVRILVISALSDKLTAIRVLKRGAHGFLQKPFEDHQLVETMIEAIHL